MSAPVPPGQASQGARVVQVWTLPEAAAQAGVEYRTLHSWVQRGLISPLRGAEGAGRPAVLGESEAQLAQLLGRLRRLGCGMKILDRAAESWEGPPEVFLLDLGDGCQLTVRKGTP